MNNVESNMLANKVIIDFDVFGTFIEDIIMSDLNGTLIVMTNNNGMTLRSTHFFKKPLKLYKLLSSVSKSIIFYLGDGLGDKRLFLATL